MAKEKKIKDATVSEEKVKKTIKQYGIQNY